MLAAKGQLTLSFNAIPCGVGELQFSDGTRLMGYGDTPYEWGNPRPTIGALFEKLKNIGYKGIEKSELWDLSTPIQLIPESYSIDTIKNRFRMNNKYFGDADELFRGVAIYRNDEYSKSLAFVLIINNELFERFLVLRFDTPSEMFIDIDMLGLENSDYNWGKWNINDTSDCGDGKMRVINGFNIERNLSFYG